MKKPVERAACRLALAATLLALPFGAVAADGMAVLKAGCVDCHSITGPAPQTLKALWDRKGPDLFYAGNKYREEWLVEWLQRPTRIRPAGEFYENHIKPGAKHDEVDAATLKDHVALSSADAAAVAAELILRVP